MTGWSQADFRAAVLDPAKAVCAQLTDGQERPAGKRFDVYRNNVVMSLKEALTQSFPVISKLLGAENFSTLAGLFVRAHPPDDPRMMLYGAAFPAFLERFAPLAHLPYLPDVARLELAQRYSYHAADAAPVDPAIFGQFSARALACAQIALAPAVRVLRSTWPVLDIWHFNNTPGAPQPRAGGQDVLITRADFDPQMHLLPKGGADFIDALAAGMTLGPALESLESQPSEFDFPTCLALLLRNSAITALTPDEAPLHRNQKD